MTNYPLPSYAASIWLAGDEINLVLPSPLDAPAHTVKFPANKRGFALALKLLRSREQASTANELKISHRASPTQYQVEALYRTISYNEKLAGLKAKKEISAKEKAEAEEFLKEFGL